MDLGRNESRGIRLLAPKMNPSLLLVFLVYDIGSIEVILDTISFSFVNIVELRRVAFT